MTDPTPTSEDMLRTYLVDRWHTRSGRTAMRRVQRTLQKQRTWPMTRNPDLRGICLAGEALQQCGLEHLLLDYADLSGADLTRACLQGSSLWGASLREATLEGTDFRFALLVGCDFRDADITKTDFRDAIVSTFLPPPVQPGVST